MPPWSKRWLGGARGGRHSELEVHILGAHLARATVVVHTRILLALRRRIGAGRGAAGVVVRIKIVLHGRSCVRGGATQVMLVCKSRAHICPTLQQQTQPTQRSWAQGLRSSGLQRGRRTTRTAACCSPVSPVQAALHSVAPPACAPCKCHLHRSCLRRTSRCPGRPAERHNWARNHPCRCTSHNRDTRSWPARASAASATRDAWSLAHSPCSVPLRAPQP